MQIDGSLCNLNWLIVNTHVPIMLCVRMLMPIMPIKSEKFRLFLTELAGVFAFKFFLNVHFFYK